MLQEGNRYDPKGSGMVLQPCRECGNPVSSQAKACPKCGARRASDVAVDNFMATGCLVYLGLVAAVVLLFVLFLLLA